MKNILFVLSVCAALASYAAKPTISNFSVTNDVLQRTVTATYDLDLAAVVTVEVQIKESGEWKPLVGADSIVGAAKRKVLAGTGRNFTWWIGRDFPGMTYDAGKLRLILKAWDLETPPTWMVVDPTCSNQTYYSCKEMIPGSIGNSLYKTRYMVFRKIPAKGVVFRMGSDTAETTIGSYARPADETPHLVTFSSDWYMAIYECSQGQWKIVMPDNPSSWAGKSVFNTVECPIENVTFNRIKNEFIVKLAERTGVDFDLPTEAQWEYSCRAGHGTAVYDGTNHPGREYNTKLDQYEWTKHNSSEGGKENWQPHPVGSLDCNPFELFDMLGNVREYVRDAYDAMYGLTEKEIADSAEKPIQDPIVTGDGAHVKRGGFYKYNVENNRCGVRLSGSNDASEEWGFRVWAPAVVK